MIPVDLHDQTFTVAEWILTWASEHSVEEVHLAYVDRVPEGTIAGAYEPVNREEWDSSEWATLHARSDELGVLVSKKGFRMVPAIIRGASIANALLGYAQNQSIELIGMPSEGRLDDRKSLADVLIEQAPCPVLSIRYELAKRLTPSIRKVLVPIDFSDRAAQALRSAREFVKHSHGKMTALNVIERTERVDQPASKWEQQYNEAFPHYRQLPKLESFLNYAEGPRVRTHPALMYGDPVEACLTYLTTFQHDLIFMATRGEGKTGLFRFGSTAQELVRKAPCPVLTYKQHDLLQVARKSKTATEVPA